MNARDRWKVTHVNTRYNWKSHFWTCLISQLNLQRLHWSLIQLAFLLTWWVVASHFINAVKLLKFLLTENIVEMANGSIFFRDEDSFVILLAICHFVSAGCHRGIMLIIGGPSSSWDVRWSSCTITVIVITIYKLIGKRRISPLRIRGTGHIDSRR